MKHKIAPEAIYQFFELSNDLLSVSDFDGYFTEVNQQWVDTMGYSREELISRPFLEFIHPREARPGFRNPFSRN